VFAEVDLRCIFFVDTLGFQYVEISISDLNYLVCVNIN
jgi:hypothetical protein